MQKRPTRRGRKTDPAAQKKLGQNIRSLREKASLTQEDLAGACDLHPTEIGRLERGERDLRLSTIVRVAAGLQTSSEKLLRGVG